MYDLTVTIIEHCNSLSYRLRLGMNLHRDNPLGTLYYACSYAHAIQLAEDSYEFGTYGSNKRCGIEYGAGLPFRQEEAMPDFLALFPCFYGFYIYAGMPTKAEGNDSLSIGSFFATQSQAQKRW